MKELKVFFFVKKIPEKQDYENNMAKQLTVRHLTSHPVGFFHFFTRVLILNGFFRLYLRN